MAEPAEAAEEVLELTEEVDDDGNIMEAAEPEPAPVEEPAAEMSEPAPEDLAAPAPPPEGEPAAPAAPLMEVGSEDAAAGAFAALASQIGSGSADNHAQRITPGGRTIEDHVLEMLRPMLREWLDKHLPQMVQRLVQREIDRIIHRSDPV